MLKVTHLQKSFATPEGVVKVIDGVDFTVAEGHCYVLLGESGCGKTTTLRCVAGLEQADGGRIEIDGVVVSDPAQGIFVPVHERPIGMVFQSYAIWPHMDVLENVAYPLTVQRPALPKAELRSRAMEMLALVGMEALAQRPASRLSGGQQQRVALARALVRKPKLLLLDEPLSNLDARLRDAMRRELSEMVARVGVTALFVTHDQAEAFALADQVAVMHKGRIVQEGAPREIYARPKSAFVATFLGAANLLAGRVLPGGTPPGSCRIALHGQGGIDSEQTLLLPAQHSPGQAVQLVVRPEDVALVQASPADPYNVLAGTVRGVSFLGGLVEYEVDLGGASLRALANPREEIAVGQTVWLRVDEARCAVFPA